MNDQVCYVIGYVIESIVEMIDLDIIKSLIT
jgi:hypothetical protein